MDGFKEAHFFSMPSQGNVYTYVTFSLSDGSLKLLQALLNTKVFYFGFDLEENGELTPFIRKVAFAHIPEGSVIVAMDAFNRSHVRDDVFIGIAFTKKKEDGTVDHVLNIYSKPESSSRTSFDLDALANNCVIIDLNYAPLHLSHALAVSKGYNREIVFLMTGCDEKVHLYNEDRLNHVFCEADIRDAFPEYAVEHTPVLWLNILYTQDYSKRISALACRCGSVRVLVANPTTGVVGLRCVQYFEGPITKVLLFKAVPNYNDVDEGLKTFVNLIPVRERKMRRDPVHLLVANSTTPSFVCMDILENGLCCSKILPNSNVFDTVISACACDIDCDTTVELVIGTFSSIIFFYKYHDHRWTLIGKNRMTHSVHWIAYDDVTGDGLKELIIATASGVHIYQRKPEKALELFNQRFELLLSRYKRGYRN